MPQAPLSNQWVSLFGSILCFSLSLAQISVGPICLGLLVPINGCEAAVCWVRWVLGWRVGLLLEWVCFGVLVVLVWLWVCWLLIAGFRERLRCFALCWYGWAGFVLVWLRDWAGFVQFCGYFVNNCIDLIFGFKSIFILDNLVCLYIWVDFVLYNLPLWFFCVWFLGLYDFFGFLIRTISWVCLIF